MERSGFKGHPYRWLVLIAFMLVTFVNQASWITFAPITGEAAEFYSTSELVIGLLSMVFMILYVLLVIPAAWVIDSRGFRLAVSLGALLTAACTLTRGAFSGDLTLVFISQVGIAVGQPLILGSITKLAARWFPAGERATAAGFATLSIYLGILAAMVVTPVLMLRYGMQGMLLAYGFTAVGAAVLFLAVARERPPTPVGLPGQDDRVLMFDGLKAMLRNREFIFLLVIFFIGLGMFNGITTWIEVIVRPRGFGIEQAGLLGGAMLVGGIIGAVIVPLVSDNLRRRKPFVILALTGLLPGLVGLSFATAYWLLLASGFWFGFFLLSAGPVGFQYGAELTLPAPEGTSNSLLIVMGQISGIVFIFAMDALRLPFGSPTGTMTGSLIGLMVLTGVAAVLATLIRESPIRATAGKS
jgi:cyanate permease